MKKAGFKGSLLSHYGQLWARGEHGVVAETGPIECLNLTMNADQQGEYCGRALNRLINEVLRDGWEPMPTKGQHWFSHRFRRHATITLPPSSAEEPPEHPRVRLRLRGIYCHRVGRGQTYHRFYSDGTVIGVSTQDGNQLEAPEWVRRENIDYPFQRGTYEVAEGTIKYTLRSELGSVDYVSKVESDHMIVNWHSHINGRRGRARYKFIEDRSIAEQRRV